MEGLETRESASRQSLTRPLRAGTLGNRYNEVRVIGAPSRSLLELVATVGVAVGLALLIQAFVVKPYRIPTGSMLPTLALGQQGSWPTGWTRTLELGTWSFSVHRMAQTSGRPMAWPTPEGTSPPCGTR